MLSNESLNWVDSYDDANDVPSYVTNGFNLYEIKLTNFGRAGTKHSVALEDCMTEEIRIVDSTELLALEVVTPKGPEL